MWVMALLALSGTLINPQGKAIGTVEITPTPHGVVLHLEGRLPQGTHALHIHEKGVCKTPDFKSAGGHYNPEGKAHGFMNEDGFHKGDLPNIHVVADTFALTLFLPYLSAEDFQAPRAVVIHQGPDDGRSQPAGAAGPRIACAELLP